MLIEYENTWPLAHIFLHFVEIQYDYRRIRAECSMSVYIRVILMNEMMVFILCIGEEKIDSIVFCFCKECNQKSKRD